MGFLDSLFGGNAKNLNEEALKQTWFDSLEEGTYFYGDESSAIIKKKSNGGLQLILKCLHIFSCVFRSLSFSVITIFE